MSHQSKVYLTRKRWHEEEWERELMRQNAKFKTKIIDINDECLEKVFMYLDIDDLINIAHTNKQLKPVADMAFARKFAKKKMSLLISYKYRGRSKLEINEEMVEIYDFQTSLWLLRCFGHLVSKLVIGMEDPLRLRQAGVKTIGYTSEYCSKSLVQITFFNMASGAFEDLKKPFSAATTVVFLNCALDGKLKHLSQWFPAMCNLDLYFAKTQLDYIEANSPHMHSLSVAGRLGIYSAERVMNALHFNPLIQQLYLDCDDWIQILQNASDSLLWLPYLHIGCSSTDFLGTDDHVFNFKNLNHLRIDFDGSTFQQLPRIPISFKRLQEFTWGLYDNHLEHSVIEFFKKHPFITKLNLEHSSVSVRQNSEDIIHVSRALPLLREVNFIRIGLSVDEVITFINHAQLLKRMCFYMTDRTGFDRLKTLLDKVWQASIDGQRMELSRTD